MDRSKVVVLSLAVMVGLTGAVAVSAFLYALEFVAHLWQQNESWTWALPLAGGAIGFLYWATGYGSGAKGALGQALVFEEVRNPRQLLPGAWAPLVFVATLITHLVGGSAGREGTAVQITVSLSDQLNRFFKVSARDRRALLIAGLSAGFGAALGTPWAGLLFGLEVVEGGRLRVMALLECFIASWVAVVGVHWLAAPHTQWLPVFVPALSLETALWLALAGVFFGAAAFGFSQLTHLIEGLFHKIKFTPIRPVIGGFALLALWRLTEMLPPESEVHSISFLGLGTSSIQTALEAHAPSSAALLKALATALTIGSGFKGGEFIPLVYIGSTLGSSLSYMIPVGSQLLAAVGFAAVFAGASQTPLACTVMAGELFGWSIVPFAAVACFVSFIMSGQRGIYGLRSPGHTKLWQRYWIWN